MNIYTSYFGNYKNIPQEFQCLSIANTKPQGLFIPTWKEVVPKWSIVKSFKANEISYELFEQMYLYQLFNTYQVNDIQKIAKLRNYLEYMNADIVLLCWEKDASHCHRLILVKFLKYFFDTSWNFMGELQ